MAQLRLKKQDPLIQYLGILFSLTCLLDALDYSGIPARITFLVWAINFSIIFLCLYKAYRNESFFIPCYFPCVIFLVWAIFGAIRGYLLLTDYWTTKNYLLGIMCVSVPCFVYVFSDPHSLSGILRQWNKIIIPIFLLFFWWKAVAGSHQFYLGPVYFLYGLFWFWLPKKWKAIVAFIILVLLIADPGARSQLIKAVLCIIGAFIFLLSRYIPKFLIKTIPWIIYSLAVMFLVLGLTGTYNIFDHTDKEIGNAQVYFRDGSLYNENAYERNETLEDTRTSIYIEIFGSALYNDYIILGRSLARGNDSKLFGGENLSGLGERYMNEIGHTNIFTWLGVIGVILFAVIYMSASWLSVFYSSNTYIPILGSFVAFHWLYGWVENVIAIDGMNIGLWTIIAMCLSPKFRKMSNIEFRIWFKSIFSDSAINRYLAYQILRLKFSIIQIKHSL